ncbi:nucleotidyltransferase family protein [Paenibacillus silvae]|uniref:nucleotidyltransferase family protein n=1 Tax=Paenibacillus silvae TaxID=1325358 RepID=UPI00200303A8|nr:NTP transferase domain-containing protein [Paenibacillus silvae]MCK6076991.1 NTP transferase domain-containing protein [Paenibacillus silvae]MCK6152751.1 NTP transferase domain-containing protein [Paenibacillus silvae]MCK6269502.1 NTP transferase domain-containing protein [Paenibacillus silvae]
MQTTGIVLAAGNSSRLGRNKLSVTMPDGVALAAWTLKAALSSTLDQIICVVKPGDHLEWLPEECLRTATGRYTAAPGLRIAVCNDHAGGMANSIRCGIWTAMEYRPEGVLMLMADQPLITARHINGVLDALASHPDADYAAAAEDADAKPPVAFRSHMFGPLLSLQGDEGARKILRKSIYRGVKVPLSRESFWDADTEPQLQKILTYAEGQLWREA